MLSWGRAGVALDRLLAGPVMCSAAVQGRAGAVQSAWMGGTGTGWVAGTVQSTVHSCGDILTQRRRKKRCRGRCKERCRSRR